MTHVAKKLKRSLPEDSVCLLDRGCEGLDHKPKAGRLRAIGQFAARFGKRSRVVCGRYQRRGRAPRWRPSR